MTILNVGYGTTDPQELLHLVQSNVTLILQDSRNNNEGTANLEFIQGPGNFGENSHIDWKLSNSNSTFCIKRAANNITSNVVVVNENGNVTVSNDMLVQGEFIRQGVNIYYHFENRIDDVNSSLENELDSTSNILFIQSSNFTVNTSNYVLKIEDEVNDRIDNANTYSLNTSNIISNRITNLSADKIANGNNNKFIVNGIYSNDFEVYGNLTASNLTIHGTTTTLNTDLYVTEQLDIQNNSDSVALNIIQHHSSSDVVNIATNTTQLLTLKNDGKFGIGTTVPAFTLDLNATDGIKLPSGGEDTKPDNLVSSNYGLIRYNTDLKTFEGYGHGGSSGAWSSLGGVKDVDADTYISAENNAGDDNDELKFFTSNFERMVITSNGLIGIGTESPAFSLDINATDGLKLPAGDEAQRPDSSTIVKGVIRYNTYSDQFEGYGAGNAWGSLGGVKDVDGDTYISAENNAGDDNDELKFVTSNFERMVITSNGLIGIGNTEPSSLLSLSGDDTTIKIQDGKNDDTGSTNIELINGPVDSFSDNTNLYNWRISNSNNQYILASGSNNQIYERFIISGETGNVGLGTQPHIFVEGENDEYKMTIKGNINVDGFIYKNGEIYRGEGSVGVISQHMPVQTQSITYTKTRIMTSTESNSQNIVPDNGWRFIDNNLTSGFVIKIKPSHVRSKILLNLSCHVGFDSIPESRWWGLKLYRKIEGLNGGNWTEVSEANGENTTGFSSCWLSHNMGANLSTYENFITNVSGTFFDEPFKGISSDIKTVYYTVKWKSNLGTYNTNSGGGELYFNRPAVLLDTSNSPVLSSSWSAQEVWQLGTPYIPGEASNVITIFDQDFVGIGNTEPQYELDVGGDINITGTYLLNNVDVFTYTSNYILRIDGEVNDRLDTTDSNLAATDTGIITTSNILFLQSSNFDAHASNYILRIDGEVNDRLDTTDSNLANTDTGIITTSNILFLQSSNFDAHASNYILRIDGEVNDRLDTTDTGIITTSNILFLQSSNFDAHASNYILRIDGEVNDRLDTTDAGIITTSNILFLQSSNFDAHASNYILRIDGEVNDRLDTTDTGIITTSNILFLQSSNFDAHASNYILRIDGEVNDRLDTTDAGIITTSNILFLQSSNFDAHASNYILRIDGEVNTRLDGVDNVDNILGFFRDTEFEKDDSDFINIKKASATNIGGIMVDNDTITIDEFGVISGSQNIDLSGYATKSYVDGIASGLVFKDSAKVATITNIASLSGTQVIDGVSVVSGDRVLVKNQSIQSENGIYICSTSAWSRSTDFDQSSDNIGAFVFIDAGNTNSGTSFVCSNDSAITIGTTDVIFTKFTSSGQLIPDNGLIQNGNEISINAKTNGGIIFENKQAIIDLSASLLEGVLPASKGGTGKNTLNDSITLGQHTIGKYVSTITAGNGLSTSGADTEISTHTLSIDAKTNGGLVIENHQLAIDLSAGSITGTLAIRDGGTGATTAAAARTALDVDISGTDNSTDVTLASVNENYLTINDQTITARQVPISLGGTGANTLDNLITLGSHTTGYFVSTITAGDGLATTGIDEELSAHTLSIDPKIGGGVVIENNKLAIDLSANSITGTLAISNGGTGTDSLTTDIIAPGTSNQFIVNDTIVPNDTVSKNIIVSGNILPSQNETFNLGSPEYKWDSLYVAANTINIGNTKISASDDGGLAMNIIKFEERINNITSNELHSLSGISKNIQEQISELNLDIIADGTSNKFIVDDSYNGSMYIASNFYVGKYFSTENPNGNLHVYGDITIEGDINTVNPLITQYHRHLSNYNIGYIDITNVDDTSNKPSIKIEHNVGYSNIIEISCKGDDGIFTISSNGFIGINRKEPMEKLDIDGNVKISGDINNITYQELDKLSGIDYNIKQQIDDNDFNQSNYVLLASNIVFTKSSNFIINTSNYISRIDDDINSRIDTTNLNIITTSNILFLQSSNFDAHASNYILRIDGEVNARLDTTDADIITTSNILFLQSSNFDAHASNYILKIDGEVNDRLDTTDADIITTSNILFLQSSNFDAHASNYILKIDGEVNDRLDDTDAGIITTSNILFLQSSNFDAHASNYILKIDGEVNDRLDDIDVDIIAVNNNITTIENNIEITSNSLKSDIDSLNDKIFDSALIKDSIIPLASANNIGGIKVGNNTAIDSFGVLSVNMTSYIGNVELRGDLVTSNLTILGDSTTLETNVFTTESLEINNTGTGAAISVTQTDGSHDIFIASNSGGEVFSIINNGNVGIGITNPQTALDVDGDINFTGNIYGSGSELTEINADNIASGTLDNARLPANILVTSLEGIGSNVTEINADNIASGTLDNARLPANILVTSLEGIGSNVTEINADNIASGTLDNARLPANILVTSLEGIGSNVTEINADNIASGTLDNARLPANILVTSLEGIGSNVTEINADNIASGTLDNARLPANILVTSLEGIGSNVTEINADNIASGTIDNARLPANILVTSLEGIGSNVTEINADNIASGTLDNARLPANILVTSLEGIGSNVTEINADNIASGTIDNARLPANILVTSLEGIGSNVTEINADNIASGTLDNARLPANILVTSLEGIGSNVTEINADNIASGTLDNARLPANILVTSLEGIGSNVTEINADNIASGTIDNARLPANILVTSLEGIGSNVTEINADNIASGTIDNARLPANILVTSLEGIGSNVTEINADNIASGTLDNARLPANILVTSLEGIGSNVTEINADNIASGTLDNARLPANILVTSLEGIGSNVTEINADNIASGTLDNARLPANILVTSLEGIGSNVTEINADNIASGTLDNARLPANILVTSLEGIGSNVTEINADNIASGTLDNARLPANILVTSLEGIGSNVTEINADNIASGTLDNARLPANILVTSLEGIGSNVTEINADNIASGTLDNARLPANILVTSLEGIGSNVIEINADNIASGTLDNARLPANILVTSLEGIGSNVTEINADNIASGTLDNARLPANILVTSLEGIGSNVTEINADNIASGTLDNARLPANILVTSLEGIGSNVTEINADNIASGTLDNARLPANILVTSLEGIGSNVTEINADNIASGTLDNARLPANILVTSLEGIGSNVTEINADNIASGTIDNARLPANILVTSLITSNILTVNGTSNALEITNDTIFAGIDIIPIEDNAIDLGSVENKFRDVFISNNSIWLGDTHKLAISDDKMKFRKRKTTSVPAAITTAGGNESDALNFTGHSNISNFKLKDWLNYMKSLPNAPAKPKISDIFTESNNDYDEENAADAWQIHNTSLLLGSSYQRVGIGVAYPTSNLDVAGDINFTGNLTQNGIAFSSFTSSDVVTVLSTSDGTGITWNSGTNTFDIDSSWIANNITGSGGGGGGGGGGSLWGETTSNNITYLYYNSNVKIDGDLLVSGSIISGWDSSADTTLDSFTSGSGGGGGGWWSKIDDDTNNIYYSSNVKIGGYR